MNGKFDLNCVAPNNPDSSSDERRLVHPDSDADNREDEVKSRMNFGDLNDAKDGKGPCMNSSEVRTLHPDLNLMAENESLSDEKSHGHLGSDTMNDDEVAKSTSNSSGLTNVKGCCVVESDNDQNGDSIAVRSCEERKLNPDLTLEGNVLENNGSLPSNSASVFVTTSFGGLFSRSDGRKSVDHETRGDDNLLEVCRPGKVRCSDIETSKAHDVAPNNGALPAGAELPTKSIECSEAQALVVCTRTAQLTSESSCNVSSVAGESCVAGIFHGSGTAKVQPF